MTYRLWLLLITVCWQAPGAAMNLTLVDDYRWDQIAPDVADQGARFGRSVVTDGEWAMLSAPQASSASGASRGGRLMLFRASASGSPWQFVKALDEPADIANCQIGSRLFLRGELLVAVATSAGSRGKCRPFVFERDRGGAGNWGLAGQIGEPSEIVGLRREGAWTDVSVSGELMAVGRAGTDFIGEPPINSMGEVAIYQRDAGGTGSWGEVAVITLPDDQRAGGDFGQRVALEGDRLVVGAPGFDDAGANSVGRAWLFERNRGGADNWGLRQTLVNPRPGSNGLFGDDIDIELDMIAIAGPAGDLTPATSNDRAVYVYQQGLGANGEWGLVDALLPDQLNSGFGGEIQIVRGLMLVADGPGVFNADGAWLFQREGDQWTFQQSLLEADTAEPEPELSRNLGLSAGLSNTGQRTVVIVADDSFELTDGGPRVGKAYFFEYEDGLFSDGFED